MWFRWLTLLKHPSSSLLQISEQPWRCCCREGTAPPAAPVRSRESCNDIDPKKKKHGKNKMESKWIFPKWSFPPTTPSKIKDKQFNQPTGWENAYHGRAPGVFCKLGQESQVSSPHLWESQIAVEYHGSTFWLPFCWEKTQQRFITFKRYFFRPAIFCPHPKNEKQKKHQRKHTVPVIGEKENRTRRFLRETRRWWHLHEVLEGEFGIEGWKDHRDEVKQTHLSGRSVVSGGIRWGSPPKIDCTPRNHIYAHILENTSCIWLLN